VEGSGRNAISHVSLLIDCIRDQGEGRKSTELIDAAFQNTPDDSKPALSRFDKLLLIRNHWCPN